MPPQVVHRHPVWHPNQAARKSVWRWIFSATDIYRLRVWLSTRCELRNLSVDAARARREHWMYKPLDTEPSHPPYLDFDYRPSSLEYEEDLDCHRAVLRGPDAGAARPDKRLMTAPMQQQQCRPLPSPCLAQIRKRQRCYSSSSWLLFSFALAAISLPRSTTEDPFPRPSRELQLPG